MPPPGSNAISTFDKKLKELRDIVKPTDPNCPHREKFFIEREVRAIWKANDIPKILPGFTPAEQQVVKEHFILVLSILVYIEWDPDEDVFREEFFEKMATRSDCKLPFEPDHDLSFMGKHVQKLFRLYQPMFKACKIITRESMKIVQYSSDRPWPFLDRKEIAAGSQSRIWRVSVAPGYYSSGKGQSNEGVAVLAYKRVRRDTARGDMDYRKELSNLEYLRESISEHKHICLHIAAIVHGPEFYVFLKYTELGDLEIFLRGGADIQDETQTRLVKIYNFEERFGNPPPSQYIRQLRNLASALHYLHEQLKLTSSDDSSSELFYCAHLDLKPKNILVFPHDDCPPQQGCVGKWMISDFGISSFESATNQRLRYQTIGDIYNSTNSPVQSSRREGGHVAPELHERSNLLDNLVVKCDIWSYGCILTRVLAFMYGAMHLWGIDRAVSEVDSFRVNLESSGQSDSFFEFQNDGPGPSCPRLKSEVGSYLDKMKQYIKSNRPLDSLWVNPFVDLILRVLIIEPAKRPRAEEIMDGLEEIEIYMRDANELQNQRQVPRPAPLMPDASGGDRKNGSSNINGTSDSNNPKPLRRVPSLQSMQLPFRGPISPPTSPPALPSRKMSGSRNPPPQDDMRAGSSYQDAQLSPKRMQAPRTPPLNRNGSEAAGNLVTPGASISPPLRGLHSSQSSTSGSDTVANNSTPSCSFDLYGDNKRKYKWALSSSADSVAYLVPSPENSSAFRVHFHDLKRLSKDDTAESKLEFGEHSNSARWDDVTARLFVASRYVSITGLTRKKVRIGLMFNADTKHILQDPFKLPEDLIDIIPSSSGIFALVCGKRNKILLVDPTRPSRGCTIDGKPGMQFLKYAFSPDGTRFFVWTRSQEADRSNQTVNHSICIWDISNSPLLSSPYYYKFEASVIRSRPEDLSLVPCQLLPACIYTKGTSRYFLWADQGSESDVCKVAPIPDETFPALKSHAEIACSTFWFVSVRTSSFFGSPGLYESFFKALPIGIFEKLSDRRFGPLKSLDVLLAASEDRHQRTIIVANPYGKIIRIQSALDRGSPSLTTSPLLN